MSESEQKQEADPSAHNDDEHERARLALQAHLRQTDEDEQNQRQEQDKPPIEDVQPSEAQHEDMALPPQDQQQQQPEMVKPAEAVMVDPTATATVTAPATESATSDVNAPAIDTPLTPADTSPQTPSQAQPGAPMQTISLPPIHLLEGLVQSQPLLPPPPSYSHTQTLEAPRLSQAIDQLDGSHDQQQAPSALPPQSYQSQQQAFTLPAPYPPPPHSQAPQTNGSQYAPQPPQPTPPALSTSGSYSYSNSAPPQQQQQPPPQDGDANGYPSQMRYSMPLPPQHMDARQMGAARHKKEIKRRTKTGCLTCRKRRIKCDEGHPTCRNCQKSKRECQGYDPIFKAQGGPPSILPISLPPPPPRQDLPMQAALPPPPPHGQYSQVPQGYMPAASAGYSSTPAPPAPSHPSEQSYDYGPSIDPALAAAQPPPPPPQPPVPDEYTTTLSADRKVRQIAFDHLFILDNIPPSNPQPRDLNLHPLTPHELHDVREMYMAVYASGLDRFFETTWYTTQGVHHLTNDPTLSHLLVHCVERFRLGPSDHNRGLQSLETRLVWHLANLPRALLPTSPHLSSLVQSIEVVTHLLLGTFMDPASVPPHPPSAPPDPKLDPHAHALWLQDSFWHHLGRFVTIHDDVCTSDSTAAVSASMGAMRAILAMLENRDVLYSMAIARHFGGRMETYEERKVLVSRSADAEDPIGKLVVAMRFLEAEEQAGTTQVVQRVCGMARRSWVLWRGDDVQREREREGQ